MYRLRVVRSLRNMFRVGMYFVLSITIANPALAALPTIGGKGKKIADNGDWLGVLIYNVDQLGSFLGMLVGALALIGTGYVLVSRFRECQQGRSEWSDLFVMGVVGAGVLTMIMMLLGDAHDLIK